MAKNFSVVLTLCFFIIPSFSVLGFGSLYFIAAILFFFRKTKPLNFYTIDIIFISTLFLTFISSIVSMLYNGFWEWSVIDKYSRFGMGAAVYMILIKNMDLIVNKKLLKVGFYIASFVSFVMASYQKLFLNYPLANGGIFSISFGEIMTIISVICLLKFENNKYEKFIYRFIFFSLSLSASLMSGARGAWIAYVAILWTVINFLFYKKTILKKIVIYISIIATFSTLIFYIPNTRNRILDAYEDIFLYYNKENYKFTSQGGRLLMWDTAFDIFLDNPLLGVGTDRVGEEIIRRKLSDNNVDDNVRREINVHIETISTHSHSDWIETLSSRGLLGFIPFLLFIFFPLYISMKYKNSYNYELRMWAFFNILVNVAFSIFTLTQSLHQDPEGFWTIFNILSFSQIRNILVKNNIISR